MNCKWCGKQLSEQRVVNYLEIDGKLVNRSYKTYRHIDGHYYHCRLVDILPNTPPAKCSICKVEKPPHGQFCSAAGKPQYHPKPN